MVFLFDVDGTLVTTPGAGRRAMTRAFAERFGETVTLRDIPFAGMTDRTIVRAGLRAVGEPVAGAAADGAIDTLLARYLVLLEEEVAAADLRLHPGIADALDAAEAQPDTALGLGTGNVRVGATIKLRRVGIEHRFGFGGFGCDHEDRAILLHTGAMRGAALLGVPLNRCRVVVVGDTPRDMAAARSIDAVGFGVGTSGVSIADLRAAWATHAVPDLSAPGALAALLVG